MRLARASCKNIIILIEFSVNRMNVADWNHIFILSTSVLIIPSFVSELYLCKISRFLKSGVELAALAWPLNDSYYMKRLAKENGFFLFFVFLSFLLFPVFFLDKFIAKKRLLERKT